MIWPVTASFTPYLSFASLSTQEQFHLSGHIIIIAEANTSSPSTICLTIYLYRIRIVIRIADFMCACCMVISVGAQTWRFKNKYSRMNYSDVTSDAFQGSPGFLCSARQILTAVRRKNKTKMHWSFSYSEIPSFCWCWSSLRCSYVCNNNDVVWEKLI